MKFIIFICFIVCFGNINNNFQQEGYASYYSNKFNGRKTTSGEIYRSNLFTAAHKKLPFGTFVKVTNLKNDSTVIVKINDRLGKKSPHIIDLSYISAKKLNFLREGKVKVKIETFQNDTIK